MVTGRVLRADGGPAAGVPVAMEREPTFGDALAGSLLVPLTFFTACLADPPRGVSPCPAASAQPGAQRSRQVPALLALAAVLAAAVATAVVARTNR